MGNFEIIISCAERYKEYSDILFSLYHLFYTHRQGFVVSIISSAITAKRTAVEVYKRS